MASVIVPTGASTFMAWDCISARMTQDATITSDHISTKTTYVMWREEHLWNVSVLERVHLSNLRFSNRPFSVVLVFIGII
jgi:hypothetical protein